MSVEPNVACDHIPSPSEGEAQLAGIGCTGELWHARARRDVFAVFSRVETLLVRSVTGEEARRGRVGRESVGAQHVGTGMGLGGKKGVRMRGSSRRLAARRSAAVVKVIANATAKRS